MMAVFPIAERRMLVLMEDIAVLMGMLVIRGEAVGLLEGKGRGLHPPAAQRIVANRQREDRRREENDGCPR